jgi:hypothetical protein
MLIESAVLFWTGVRSMRLAQRWVKVSMITYESFYMFQTVREDVHHLHPRKVRGNIPGESDISDGAGNRTHSQQGINGHMLGEYRSKGAYMILMAF